MADRTNLDHLFVHGLATDQPLNRKSPGDPKIRPVEDRAGHGAARRQEVETAADEFCELRGSIPTEELRSLGVIITIRAASAEYPLKLESLERWSQQRDPARRRPRWQLLAVGHDETGIESAAVWIADEDIADFFKFFDDYLAKDRPSSQRFPEGHPYNDELVANMGEIRRGVAADMWTSGGSPPTGQVWWELVLRSAPNSVDVLRQIAEALNIRVSPSTLEIGDRIIVWVEARWSAIELLTLTKAPLHEIRRPSQVNLVLELPSGEQDDYVDELIGRLDDPGPDADVAVCLLDTGVLGGHNLIAPFINATDIHTAVPPHAGADALGHGTRLAGLALFGDLQPRFDEVGPVNVRHSLESVKVLPDTGQNDRASYALITARAVALPEIERSDRFRVFNLAVTAVDQPVAGEPTTWSTTIDALAAGTEIDASADGTLRLLGAPDPDAGRLIVISGGNVRDAPKADYLAQADANGIEEPAQAWNALTVGAYTAKVGLPSDPSFHGWTALAAEGELSPHSRTGVIWARQWPNKPDVVLEGGNVLVTDGGMFDADQPCSTLTTTAHDGLTSLASVNATSAATALASNLAARIALRYPTAWPETVRALMVHSAEWTDAMKARFEPASKTGRFALLRRYGWCVPDEDRALSSASNAATIILQDEFQPFSGRDHTIKRFRLHNLPWPASVLRDLGEVDVRLRVTVSYFIEPSVASRGWRTRYSYASHGLRFELKRPLEPEAGFIRRINNTAEYDENGEKVPSVTGTARGLGLPRRPRGQPLYTRRSAHA